MNGIDEFTSDIMEMLLGRNELLKRLEVEKYDLECAICYATLIKQEQRMVERIQKEINEFQVLHEQHKNEWLDI